MRIIFVPQYPTPMRYQEFWFIQFPIKFKEAGFEVITLGNEKIEIKESNLEMFSPINDAINFECNQINEYIQMELRDDDILFMADISFPGFFMNVLYHKRPKKVFSFCHATSLNNLDYFEPNRRYKYPVELAHSQMCDKVFIGSNYHKNKLNWNNTIVTYLPFPPPQTFITLSNNRSIDIISASRPTPQKVDLPLEKEVEQKFGKIKRTNCNNWEEYYAFLSQSKVLLITSKEDTFGLQIIDAISNGCIPLARNSFAYPEILSEDYLYNNKNELMYKIEQILNGKMKLPSILCEKQMNNFYDKIIMEMKGN